MLLLKEIGKFEGKPVFGGETGGGGKMIISVLDRHTVFSLELLCFVSIAVASSLKS